MNTLSFQNLNCDELVITTSEVGIIKFPIASKGSISNQQGCRLIRDEKLDKNMIHHPPPRPNPAYHRILCVEVHPKKCNVVVMIVKLHTLAKQQYFQCYTSYVWNNYASFRFGENNTNNFFKKSTTKSSLCKLNIYLLLLKLQKWNGQELFD